jgi:NADH-quinone oxidoreductase subunit G
MCLVEIERSPKPMPACATQCMDGMVIKTRSSAALAAQKSTMEFLLINHPLDCPICDQGGECELQDVAMGFGEGVSKYTESKRVVMDKNIGPLIATDFTPLWRRDRRHAGTRRHRPRRKRGDRHLYRKIDRLGTFRQRHRRMPGRRPDREAVALHGQALGADPARESWISDRDRFSYTSVGAEQRISQPMLRDNGELRAVDWETALNTAANRLADAGGSIAALVSPQATLEEHYLAQKLLRGLGSNHIDHRLTQLDFSSQRSSAIMPWLGRSLESVEKLDAALIVGASLRFEQPLLSHRLRKAVQHNNARVSSIGHIGDQYNFALDNELSGSAAQLVNNLAGVAVAVAAESGKSLGQHLASLADGLEPSSQQRSIASSLIGAENAALIVGVQALANPHLSLIQEICEAITAAADATLGYLSLSANSAGACLAGATPHRGPAGVAIDDGGEHAAEIMTSKHRVLMTFALNPLLDTHSVSQLSDNNEFVIALSSYDNDFIQQHLAALSMSKVCGKASTVASGPAATAGRAGRF